MLVLLMLSLRCRNVISFLSPFESFSLLEESSEGEEEDSQNAVLPSFHLFVVVFDVLRSSTPVEEVRFASVENAFELDSGMSIHCCVFEKGGKSNCVLKIAHKSHESYYKQGTVAVIEFQRVMRALTLFCDVAMTATAAAVQFRTEPGLLTI